MTIWFSIAGMTLITFINRYLFFAERIRFKPSNAVTRFLSFSSFAILTAIWTPIIFDLNSNAVLNGDPINFGHAGMDYLVASLVAASMAFMQVRSIVVVLLSTTLFFFLRFFVFS